MFPFRRTLPRGADSAGTSGLATVRGPPTDRSRPARCPSSRSRPEGRSRWPLAEPTPPLSRGARSDAPFPLAGSGPTLAGRMSPVQSPVPATNEKVRDQSRYVQPKRSWVFANETHFSRERQATNYEPRVASTRTQARAELPRRLPQLLGYSATPLPTRTHSSRLKAHRSQPKTRETPRKLGSRLALSGFSAETACATSACLRSRLSPLPPAWPGSFVLRCDPLPVGRRPSGRNPRVPLGHRPASRRCAVTYRDLGDPTATGLPPRREDCRAGESTGADVPGDPCGPSLPRYPSSASVELRGSPVRVALPAEAVRVSGKIREPSSSCQPESMHSFRVLSPVFPFCRSG